MNFGKKSVFAVPFEVEQKQIENEFLMWSRQKEEVPLDFMQNSQILEIKKVYFPIRRFSDIHYHARWEAKSFWEHKEPYTVYESKIVYLDHLGHEHDSKLGAEMFEGSDFKAQAVSKTVPVTRYKTVVDDVEDTSGKVTVNVENGYINYNPNQNEKFGEWFETNIRTHSEKYQEYKHTEDYCVYDLYGNDEEAFSAILEPQLFTNASDLAKENIPGDRYEDFSLKKLECEYGVSIILLPIYHVKYSYGDSEYEYYVNGEKSEDMFIEKYPVDEEYVSTKNELTQELQKESDSELKYLGLAVLSVILLIIGGLCGAVILLCVSSICAIVFGILCNKKAKKAQALREQLKTFNEKREKTKEQLNSK